MTDEPTALTSADGVLEARNALLRQQEHHERMNLALGDLVWIWSRTHGERHPSMRFKRGTGVPLMRSCACTPGAWFNGPIVQLRKDHHVCVASKGPDGVEFKKWALKTGPLYPCCKLGYTLCIIHR